MAGMPIRILVVEDEFLIRMTLAEALVDEGFEVLEADSGDAALPIVQGDPAIALLITDIQLPGSLNGHALAAAARGSRPNLPVLFTTGRPNPDALKNGVANEAYLSKPYTLADVASTVRRMVAAPV